MGSHYQDSAEVMYNVLRWSCDKQHYGHPDADTGRVNNTVGWGRVNADRALASISRGDPNNDRLIDISDVVCLIARIFSGGPAPMPNMCTGDANCDGAIDISDAVTIIAHIFSGGTAPRKICQYSVCH
jgi:hypothetical protein